jgi:hypothetical protein
LAQDPQPSIVIAQNAIATGKLCTTNMAWFLSAAWWQSTVPF